MLTHTEQHMLPKSGGMQLEVHTPLRVYAMLIISLRNWLLFTSVNYALACHKLVSKGRIFSHVRPFYERAVSYIDP
jgi:hypothetical protein